MNAIVEYNPDTGEIYRWHQPHAPTLNDDAAELEVSISAPDDLVGMRVDMSGEMPTVVPNSEADVSPTDSLRKWAEQLEDSQPVTRRKVSTESMTAFRDAQSTDDMQTQLDVLFKILTGEEP